MTFGLCGFGTWASGSREGRRPGGQAETIEDGDDDFGLDDVGDDASATATGARQNIVEIDTS
jgi:hypothetical protein